MKTTFFKGSKFIVFAMMFIAALTTFTACGGDDEDESNTVKINGQETKTLLSLVNKPLSHCLLPL